MCSVQVPFMRGGAEIFADDLVAELRRRGHEADLVTMPFKWYPGARVLTQSFLWRLLDLEEAAGRPDRPGDRDEVPVLRRASSEQGRVAAPPVPAGVRARPHGARAVRRGPAGPGAPADRARARPRRARRGAARVRHVAEPRRPAPAVDRDRRRRAAAPAAGAALPLRGLRGLHPVRRPARPREAHRPAARGARAAAGGARSRGR